MLENAPFQQSPTRGITRMFFSEPINMRFSRMIVALFLCGLALHVNASSQTSLPAPIKIICIGDSITQGGNIQGEYSYRLSLFRLLKQKGFNVSFIGTRTEGLNKSFHWPGDFDSHHEGFYGAQTDFVRHALMADLPKLPAPDIALIDLGSNDPVTDVENAMINPLTDIVSQLRAKNPQVKIFIVQIPGIFVNFTKHYWTWRMAHKLSQPRSPITTIPLYFGWDTKGDTFDGAHPNIKGQNKMAIEIFSALEPILQAK
jgi:lysophospholipase L1-like esterase